MEHQHRSCCWEYAVRPALEGTPSICGPCWIVKNIYSHTMRPIKIAVNRTVGNPTATNLQWFRVRIDAVSFVGRKRLARISNPFTDPEPVIDVDEIMEHIVTVKEENLKRLEDDIDILRAYLKTHAPKAAIEALEGLTVEQHVSWKKAVDRIQRQPEE
jgi:hypothetical protein